VDSAPSSPKSPSPKGSPGSKSPSPHLLEIDQPHHKNVDSFSTARCEEMQVSDELAQLGEVEQELSDEMIVKEDPLLSTRLVQDFKSCLEDIDTHEVSSQPECKDVVICSETLVNPLDSSLSLVSTSFPYSENVSYEMPSGQQQEEESFSPFSSGFVATDSKDSLDVQVHSVVDDFSGVISGREESLDDIKHQHAASLDDSEDGQNSKDDDAVEDFEMIQEFEVDEARLAKKVTTLEPIPKLESETVGSSQMQDVMEIFEKIENESIVKKEEIDKQDGQGTAIPDNEVKLEAPGTSLKTVMAKIERFVENEDEIISTSAYVTTSNFEISEQYMDSQAVVFTPGILKITIIKAMGLVNQDFVGKSDPYVIIKYNGHVHRSHTICESLDPVWNFCIDLEVTDAESEILIEVYDDDYGRDNFEGGLTLKVADFLQHADHEPILYDLKGCKSGSLLVSSSYSSSVVSVPDTHNMEVVAKENVRPSSPSSSSSSSEKVDHQPKLIAETSTDSSVSTKQESTIKKLNHQDTVEENDSLVLDTQKEKKISSDDSSDTEDEKRDANISSSDYDSSVHVPPRGNRPESFISDNSSDYDSLSDVGRRRPQSFALDDEYEVISEEEANESENKISKDTGDSAGVKENQKNITTEQAVMVPAVVPSAVTALDKQQGGDENEPILTDLDGISEHTELFPSSLTSTLEMHVEESSVSRVVAQSSVSISKVTLDNKDLEKISFCPSQDIAGLDSSNPLDTQGIGL
jgi:hypothetical protein